jgi:hypothetical protein
MIGTTINHCVTIATRLRQLKIWDTTSKAVTLLDTHQAGQDDTNTGMGREKSRRRYHWKPWLPFLFIPNRENSYKYEFL